MAKPTIIRGSDHHFSFTYKGSGLGQRVGTFVPFTDDGTISKSCYFDDGNNEHLHRTPGSNGNRRTWTWSAWVKRVKLAQGYMFMYSDASANTEAIQFDSSNRLHYYVLVSSSYQINYISNRTFEDLGEWIHIVVRKDTTQSTAADRVRIYVNGTQITSWATATQPSQNDEGFFNQSGKKHGLGNFDNASYDDAMGYLAEVNFIDGTSYGPDTFGVEDSTSSRWIPKTLGSITYGTHGFRMQFANSAGQTIGDDTSGQGNDYTVVNVGTHQISLDTPTSAYTNFGGDKEAGGSASDGNMKVTTPGSGGGYNQCVALAQFGVSKGKWYWECRINTKGAAAYGWKSDDNTLGSQAGVTGNYKFGPAYNVGTSGGFADGEWDCNYSTGASEFSAFATSGVGDIIMFAIDLDNRKGYVGKNGTWFNSANPANGTGSIGLGRDPVPSVGAKFYPMCLRLDSSGVATYNFGQNPSFSSQITAAANTASSGPGLFKYTPPTDFVAINRDNIPSSNKGIVSFAWADNIASGHNVFRDSSRGDETVFSPSTSMQASPRGIVEFLQGGYRLDQDDLVGGMDAADSDFVSWNWVGNNGTLAANTDGSGATLASTTQANQTAGFSIVLYTGDGNSNRKIAHGLSSAPEFIATRARGSASWYTYIKSAVAYDTTPQNRYMRFDSDDSHSDYETPWADTVPTSSVFSIGSTQTNNNTTNYVAYCWHSVEGYSKIGSYHGNGQTDGPMVLTGFKPAWLLVKAINVGNGWRCFDNVRDKFNPRDKNSRINEAGGQLTGDNIDFLANGFKIQNSDGDINGSYHYIFMAFAERPFVGDGTNPGMAG